MQRILSFWSRAIHRLTLAACTLSALSGPVVAESRWIGALGGNWSNAANWNGPVPDAPAEVAILQNLAGSNPTITLDVSTTLGQLDIVGPSVYSITGTNSITFDRPGVEAAVLNVRGTAKTHQIGAPIDIADGEQLAVDVIQNATLRLTGGIAPGSGSLSKSNSGTLELNAGSAGWDGNLVVDRGTVAVRHNAALGSTAGNTTINADGTVILYTAGPWSEGFRLNGGTLTSSSGTSTMNLPGTLDLQNTSTVVAGYSLVLNAEISGPGGLIYNSNNSSGAYIYGDNDYEGVTTISKGRVFARHANALGSAAAGTVVMSGSELSIEFTNSEPITLRGGTVSLANAVQSTGTIVIESGRLQLPSFGGLFTSHVELSNSTAATIVGREATFTGGVSGVGNLQVDGPVTISGQPLSFDGSLTIGSSSSQPVVLETANTYTGTTTVGTGTLVANHPDALGTSNTPILVNGGTLELKHAIQREVHMKGGSLRNFDTVQGTNSTIKLMGGSIVGGGIYNGEVQLSGVGGGLRGGTFNGVVSGSTDVSFGSSEDIPGFGLQAAKLNANNTYTGLTQVHGRVEANTPGAFGTTDRGTIVEFGAQLEINSATDERFIVAPNGRVNVNVQLATLPRLTEVASPSIYDGLQTVAINTPSVYHEHYDVNEGVLEIKAPVQIDSLAIRNGGKLQVNAGKLTTASTEIVLLKGEIQGAVNGATAIRKTTTEFGYLGGLPGFDGDVIVEKGVLQIDSNAALGTSVGRTIVNGNHDAVLEIRGPVSIHENIYLNDAQGIDGSGGLYVPHVGNETPVSVLNGRLDLGQVGSVIGGGDSSSTFQRAILETRGPISGGSLTTRGRWLWLQIVGDQNTYSGSTDIREGSVVLAGDGRLTTTSAIVLHENTASDKGSLIIDNYAANRSDRVGDSIPIHMRGGGIRFDHESNVRVTETLGATSFLEGNSELEVSNANLTLTEVDRQLGATARVNFRSGIVKTLSAPPTVNGVIPWMVVNDGNVPGLALATATNGVIQQLNSFSSMAAASSASNVLVSTATTISSDKTVNSLSFSNQANLNLVGHRLTVDAGATFAEGGYTISNGELTAGAASGHELFVFSGQISANIVDAGDQAVNVTVTRGATFSGTNSYTGTTYVNEGTLELTSPAAVREGADFEIVGGIVSFNFPANDEHLGSVRIAADGYLGGRADSNISFDELVLEDGGLRPGRIFGTGSIYKVTAGEAFIGAQYSSGSTYSGNVFVEEGRLTVSELSQAKFHVSGGNLTLVEGANEVTLDGGAFEFLRHTGIINVLSDSRIITQPPGNSNNAGLAGSFVGNGGLTFENPPYSGDPGNVRTFSTADAASVVRGHSPQFSGSVDIRTATVLLRHADSLGSGEITVHAGGMLVLAPIQANYNDAKLDLASTVRLAGGELTGGESVFRPQRIVGDLHISENSYISTLHVPGNMYLANGSRLITRSGTETRFLGNTFVEGVAELYVTRTINEGNRDSNVIQLGGRIVSSATQSILKIYDSKIDRFVFDSSFHVNAGQTLQILLDDAPIEIKLGSGAALTGNGTFLNPVRLSGGVIDPGQSPGLLSFADDLTIGEGTVYEWEINDALGNAGDTSGWDLIDVSKQLSLDSTAAQPWIMRVTGLNELNQPGAVQEFDPHGTYRWLVATADSILGFDPSAVRVEIGGSPNANPAFRRPNFSLAVEGGDLYLDYQYRVPEPSALGLLVLGCLAGWAARRR